MVWLALARRGSADQRRERSQSVSSAHVRSVQCLELPDVPGRSSCGGAHTTWSSYCRDILRSRYVVFGPSLEFTGEPAGQR